MKTNILLEVGNNEVEFLLFRLAKQRYGINVSKVCQIMRFDTDKVTPLPHQRSEVVGVMTFREKTISVVDLRISLDKPACTGAESERRLILVAEYNQRTIGFIVDEVERIERCSWDKFEPVTNTTLDQAQGGVVGLIPLEEGIVVVLDVEMIMGFIDPSTTVEHYAKEIPPSSISRGDVRILYCEDSAVVRKTLIKTLEAAGFTKFHTFTTGAEGLEFLEKNGSQSVDLILSDIEMPKMDGLTFCKRVRSLAGFEKLPFIFFSSMINNQMTTKCLSVGADAAFSKPEAHELVAAIEGLISRQ